VRARILGCTYGSVLRVPASDPNFRSARASGQAPCPIQVLGVFVLLLLPSGHVVLDHVTSLKMALKVIAPSRSAHSTSSLGVGRRESHDASGFYARFSPPRLSTGETEGRKDRAVTARRKTRCD